MLLWKPNCGINTIWTTCALVVALQSAICLSQQQQQQQNRHHTRTGRGQFISRPNRRPLPAWERPPAEEPRAEASKQVELTDLLPDCAGPHNNWMGPACKHRPGHSQARQVESQVDDNRDEELLWARINRMRGLVGTPGRAAAAEAVVVEENEHLWEPREEKRSSEVGAHRRMTEEPIYLTHQPKITTGPSQLVSKLDDLQEQMHEDWLRRARSHRSDRQWWSQQSRPRKKSGLVQPAAAVDLDGGGGGQAQQQEATNSTTSLVHPEASTSSPSEQQQQPGAYLAEEQRFPLECVAKEMTFMARKSDKKGSVCRGLIKVRICYGSCDTGEIADWLFPYKKSYHKVCSHGSRIKRRALLPDCVGPAADEDPSFREYHYVDAGHCACQKCNSVETTCLANIAKPLLPVAAVYERNRLDR